MYRKPMMLKGNLMYVWRMWRLGANRCWNGKDPDFWHDDEIWETYIHVGYCSLQLAVNRLCWSNVCVGTWLDRELAVTAVGAWVHWVVSCAGLALQVLLYFQLALYVNELLQVCWCSGPGGWGRGRVGVWWFMGIFCDFCILLSVWFLRSVEVLLYSL